MACDYHSIDTESIQKELDANIRLLSEGWNGYIPFHCFVIEEDLVVHTIPTEFTLSEIDICEYVNGKKYPAARLAFCPTTYKPPSSHEEMSSKVLSDQCQGWIDLRRDLELAAWESGNPIISNGHRVSSQCDTNNRVFRCGISHRGHRTTTCIDTTDEIAYRCSTLINDRANNRRNGQKLPKRIKVVDKSGLSCKFGFTVKWVLDGYFYIELRQRSGCSLHSSHARFIDPQTVPVPTRLLTSDQIENIAHVVNATSNNATGRNLLHTKFGKFINSMKAAYLCRKHNGELSSARDDITVMLDNLVKSNEISFVSLADVPVADYFGKESLPASLETVTVSTSKPFTGEVQYSLIDDSSDISTLLNQISLERRDRQLMKDDSLFIGVAWIVKPAFRLFKLCPEVVWVDVTSHSNNKGFHLLTFSSRLSIGKQIVWLWIFIPNQQRFSFRWVFQEAMPTLVPKWLRDRVLFFMKDADPQQRNEIQSSMKRHFVNATEGTCGYHIVNIGWKKHVPNCTGVLTPVQLRKWSNIVHNIHRWIYSWMNPGYVEDEEEYEISKFLLEKYVCSHAVRDVVGDYTIVIERIIHFLRRHVYTWETLYLHYLRSHIRHFDTAHSSAHEGTNHGLKSHSCAVTPMMNVDTSAKTMNTQTSIRVHECEEIIFREANCTHKKWSNLPSSSHTVTLAEGIMAAMMSRLPFYEATLVSRNSSSSAFQVISSREPLADPDCIDYQNDEENKNSSNNTKNNLQKHTPTIDGEMPSSPIPLFARIRTVTVDYKGTIFCTCKHFERIGFPGVHQACVASFCHNNGTFVTETTDTENSFTGFTHHDMSVRWWSQYMYYAYRSTTPTVIVQQFHTLAINPIRGPKLRCLVPGNIPITPPQEIEPAICRLKNYPKNVIRLSEFRNSVLSQRRIHLSQTEQEEEENDLFDYINTNGGDHSGGDISDFFSDSIHNSHFPSPQRETRLDNRVLARNALKQLIEECCAEADGLGRVDGILRLEDNLKSFLRECNEIKSSKPTSSSGKECLSGTEHVRQNVPMTHAKYQGSAKRIFNTHHM